MKNTNSIRKLTVAWGIAFAILIFVEIVLRVFAIPIYMEYDELLASYQYSKISKAQDGGVLFLGDSSLGNAINADLVSMQMERPGYNLALVGSVGTYGDYLTLKAALKKNFKPEAIVIMHTTDLWTRDIVRTPIMYDVVYEADNFRTFAYNIFSSLETVRLSKLALKIIFDGDAFKPSLKEMEVGPIRQSRSALLISEYDYMPQGEPVDYTKEDVSDIIFDDFHVNYHVQKWFDKTIDLAHQHGIEVYVAYGPILEQVYHQNKNYFEEYYKWFVKRCAQKGCHILYEQTPALAPHLFGNTEDHLNARGRGFFSLHVGQILKNKLEQ